MKKIILVAFIISIFSINAQAINLDKIVGVVNEASATSNSGKSPLDDLQKQFVSKIEEKVNKVTDRIEKRVEKFESKFDEYEAKINKVEKVANQVINTVENLNVAKFEQYITYAKIALITFVLMSVLSFILLVFLVVKICKVNCILNQMKK